MKLLELIDLNEVVPIMALTYLLAMVGSLMIHPRSVDALWAGRIAAGTFIVYTLAGLVAWAPSRVSEALSIVVKAILAAGLVWAISRIVLPVFFFVYDRTVGAAIREAEKAREDLIAGRWWCIFDYIKRKDFEEQRRLEQKEKEGAAAPISVDVEVVAREAKKRYERKLAVIEAAAMGQDEREAAKRKAHQQYLRELDGAL
jgi:hypothetical protein